MTLNIVPAGPPAIAALRAAIVAAKGGDPLAPVTVAVPSNYAGLSLRRVLGADGGLVNVRFMVLVRVAELLGAPGFAASGRLPLTPALRAEVSRAALDSDPGLFAPVADHAATAAALETTFRDLRELTGGVLDALAARSPRAASVVALFRAYRARCEGQFYDETDLAHAAAEAVRAGSAALRDLGRVVLYQPRRLGPAEGELVRALRERGLAHVILAATGDPEGDAPLARVATAAGEPAPPALPATAPIATHLVVAPDLEEEARSAIRMVLERAGRGTPLHRIAILFRDSDPYARVVHEQLAAGGIAASGPAVDALADTVPGRALLAMFHLAPQDFRRDLVFDWLTAAPIRDAAGAPVPAARWDVIARSAGVVKGKKEWQARLAHHAAELANDADRRAAEGRDAMARRLRADIEQVAQLRAFMDELFERLGGPPAESWDAAATRALALFEHYLGSETAWQALLADGADPALASQVEAYTEIAKRIRQLGQLDAAGFRPTPDSFLRTLEAALRGPAGRSGPVGQGVFVGPLQLAAGMDFDAVFVLGAAEALLPPRVREDPLLPDDERRAGGDAVELREGRHGDERRAYLLALATAPERVVLYPRASQRDQRKHFPSRWFLESAGALSGRVVTTNEVASLPSAAWLTSVDSFPGAIAATATPLSLVEYELRALAELGTAAATHAFVTSDPQLARGLQAAAERLSDRLGEWEGVIGPEPGLAPTADRPTSPTALENWATCPYRYFLGNVLGVSEFEEPTTEVDISPLDRGTILHRVLERFFEEVRPASPGAEWTSADRARMEAIAREAFDDAERKGLTGRPLPSRLARQRLLRDALGLLDKEHARRDEYGFEFAHAELPFGRVAGDIGPVEFDLGDGRVVAFRGQIDRVDRGPGGLIGVADYKTGKPDTYKSVKDDIVDGGKHLQLPVYALAACKALGGEGPVLAEFWFVSEEHRFDRVGHEIGEAELARTREVLGTIVAGIAGGCFPAVPGGPGWGGRPDNCHFCAFDRVCSAGRVRTWERKQNDPGATAFHVLGGGDAAS
ncbi:MAG: PD-(D/E)XK nuclease family protein [Dehalococcoidia bacterium]|nr:PD-(D/E)XK nuclease family protein [Dehalococcoidia bacterium]